MATSIGTTEPEQIDTVVIGAGQAGLSTGYHLAKRGREFVILESNPRVGDSWRKRWDSLRLFTPARFDGLVGMPFPAPRDHFPTKDEMADYLEAYAAQFALPVRTGTRVNRVWREGAALMIATDTGTIEASNVVIAMASYQAPRVPAFASSLGAEIGQLHSREYKRLGQLRRGGVLIVGAGNSGAEIGLEIASAGIPTYISGRSTGQVPFSIGSRAGRLVLAPLMFRVLFHRVLSVTTPIGRKVRPKMLGKGAPLIRTRERNLVAAGATRVGRVTGVRDGMPLLEDGRVLDVANVILVHRLSSGALVGRASDLRCRGRPDPGQGCGHERAGDVFRRTAFSVRDVLHHDPWRRPRCGVHRARDRSARAVGGPAHGSLSGHSPDELDNIAHSGTWGTPRRFTRHAHSHCRCHRHHRTAARRGAAGASRARTRQPPEIARAGGHSRIRIRSSRSTAASAGSTLW